MSGPLLLSVISFPLPPGHDCHFSLATAVSGSSFGAHVFGASVVGFGVLFACLAIHNYNTLRLLKKTSLAAIGGLAPGLVRICGKAVGANLLTSPITRLPCLYYGLGIARVPSSPKQQTQSLLVDTEHVKFHLQDATGKILIDLHQAELDIFLTFNAETGPRASTARTIDPGLGAWTGPSEGELLAYFSQANARIHAEQVARHEGVARASMNERSFTVLDAALPPGIEGERLIFTEYCLLPDREYNILGTCMENPNPSDLRDRNVIARGGSWRHFVISCRDESVLEKSTKWTGLGLFAASVVFIVGGTLLYVYLGSAS